MNPITRLISASPHQLAQDPQGRHLSLWMGPTPPPPPSHPGLAQHHDTGLLDGAPAWLERRPKGGSLAQLAPDLHPADLALVLLDAAEALAVLHTAGLHHGGLSAHSMVVDEQGQAVLVGVGLRSADAQQDVAALRALMRALWSANASAPPDPGPEPALVLAESLDGWLAYEYPGVTRHRLAKLSGALTPDTTTQALLWQSTGFDEVGMNLGPERSGHGGLLDFWSTGRSRSGAHTAAVEGTLPKQDLREVPGRGALLARLLAPPRAAPDPKRFAEIEGQPLRALKELLAEEPLDPVPMCEGPALGAPLSALPEAQPDLASTTVTQQVREEVSSRLLALFALVALALALGALALVVALLR